MRITTRLTLSLCGVGMLLFGVYAFLLLGDRRDAAKAAVEHEIRLLGRSLQAMAEHALRDDKAADVLLTLQRVEAVDPALDVFTFGPDGRLLAATAERTDCSGPECELASLAMANRARELRFDSDEEGLRGATLALPLLGADGELLGALAVHRPLDDLREAVQGLGYTALLSVGVFLLIALAAGLVLGSLVVGRPLSRLVLAMRRVAAGDLHARLPAERNDEIGRLARQFNAMVEEVEATRAALEEAVASRRALEHSLQRADRLAAVGQLAARLAHEIGSPLQVLGGRARSLAQRPEDPERVRRHADIMADQADRISRIVKQLVDYARQRPPRAERVDVAKAVRDVADLLQPEARRAQVTLACETTDPPPTLWTDRDRLQQVAFNLAQNALHATPAGGVVTVRVTPERIGTSTGVRLSVADTGRGMTPDEVAHAFDAFFTTRADSGGAGLGLAVVRSIVEEHGGTVELRSGPGEGTVATAILPDLPVPVAADEGPGPAPDGARGAAAPARPPLTLDPPTGEGPIE